MRESMRDMIVSDPEIMMGRPVLRGTRITAESIVERVGEGESIEAIVDAHPGLTREAVLAAMNRLSKICYRPFKRMR